MPLAGRVVDTSGGDTLTVLGAKFQQHNTRLVGIDAPESEQSFDARSQLGVGNRSCAS